MSTTTLTVDQHITDELAKIEASLPVALSYNPATNRIRAEGNRRTLKPRSSAWARIRASKLRKCCADACRAQTRCL